MSTESISFEVVKLLLQVAWADHDVAAEEAQAILAFARRHELTEDQLAMVEDALSGGSALPLPNLRTLKLHKVRVLGELRELRLSDLHVHDEEDAILKQVSALL